MDRNTTGTRKMSNTTNQVETMNPRGRGRGRHSRRRTAGLIAATATAAALFASLAVSQPTTAAYEGGIAVQCVEVPWNGTQRIRVQDALTASHSNEVVYYYLSLKRWDEPERRWVVVTDVGGTWQRAHLSTNPFYYVTYDTPNLRSGWYNAEIWHGSYDASGRWTTTGPFRDRDYEYVVDPTWLLADQVVGRSGRAACKL